MAPKVNKGQVYICEESKCMTRDQYLQYQTSRGLSQEEAIEKWSDARKCTTPIGDVAIIHLPPKFELRERVMAHGT